MINIEDRIMDLYSEWLWDYCPDEIKGKDHHLELIEKGHRWDEFAAKVLEAIGVEIPRTKTKPWD